jgi:hypothetical protein
MERGREVKGNRERELEKKGKGRERAFINVAKLKWGHLVSNRLT